MKDKSLWIYILVSQFLKQDNSEEYFTQPSRDLQWDSAPLITTVNQHKNVLTLPSLSSHTLSTSLFVLWEINSYVNYFIGLLCIFLIFFLFPCFDLHHSILGEKYNFIYAFKFVNVCVYIMFSQKLKNFFKKKFKKFIMQVQFMSFSFLIFFALFLQFHTIPLPYL